MPKIVILGGGITGLASAFYLSKLKDVTLVVGPQVGGWLKSVPIQHGKQSFVFEKGPRSLRPVGTSGHIALELIHDLGLESKVITVPGDSPAYRNRYIYHQNSLENIPTSLWKLLTSKQPLAKGLVASILKEPLRKASMEKDESIQSFMTRRFGSFVTNNLISAMVRGIYAGNIANLSIRSTFPTLKVMEEKYGSIVAGMVASIFSKSKKYQSESREAQDFIEEVSKSRIYTLRGGLQTLSDRLVQVLKDRNVNVVYENCVGLEFGEKVAIKTHTREISADYVINALPASALSSILPNSITSQTLVKCLESISSVDVCVVNLLYDGKHIKEPGFGFLVPASESKNCQVLGVVFDSCTFPEHFNNGNFTSLTVMIGDSVLSQPMTEKELLNIACDTVSRTLGIPKDSLLTHHLEIHRQCIPQYPVGHQQNMQVIEDEILKISQGRAFLAGASYYGVSVNDCIHSGYKAARNLMSKLE